jgi:hypothetical protein
MNDTISLILATSILALGGLGLYVYKNNSDDNDSDEYNEDSIFDTNFFGNSKDEDIEYDENDSDNEDYKPKTKKNQKTKRSRKTGTTKRRY